VGRAAAAPGAAFVVEREVRPAELPSSREEGYIAADHVVGTSGAALDEVILEVVSLARDRGGW